MNSLCHNLLFVATDLRVGNNIDCAKLENALVGMAAWENNKMSEET